jgi:hypothetical protein
MSGKRLGATPLLIAVAFTLFSVVVAGCGKSSASSSTSTSTNAAQTTPVTLTYAQAVAAGDAICTTAANHLASQIALLESIQKSKVSSAEINLKSGPIVERIGGETRGTARLIYELKVPASDVNKLRSLGGTLLELAVIEEQLSQALRSNEPSRIKLVTPEITHIRAHARSQAKTFGFHVCGATTRTPVA